MPAEVDQPATISAVKVDALCKFYEDAKKQYDSAKDELDDAKAILLDAVEKFGYVPTNAEKSRRLDGVDHVATATTATTVEIDNTNVHRLQLSLARAKQSQLFRELFTYTVKYGLKKDAGERLKSAKIPGRLGTRCLELFAMCFAVNSKTPSLAVEPTTEVKAREESAAKRAAKKAARS